MATVNGTSGNDFIHVAGDGLIAPPGYTDNPGATNGDDTIDPNAGSDTIHAGAGDDAIVFDPGKLDPTDQIDGGAGNDTLVINGLINITFGAKALTSIENIQLAAVSLPAGKTGSDSLTLNKANIAPGGSMTFDASALGADISFKLDGRDATNAGPITVVGGAGNDTVLLSGNDAIDFSQGGDDTFVGAAAHVYFGGALTSADRVIGRNSSTVQVYGNYYAGLTLTGSMLNNIGYFIIGKTGGSENFNYHFTLANDQFSRYHGLSFVASNTTAGSAVYIDGSAVTDASLALTAGGGDDTFIGGAGNDNFYLGIGGNYTFEGNAGNDSIYAGNGALLTASDKLDGGTGANKLILNGDYSAGLAFSSSWFTNIQTIEAQNGGGSYVLRTDGSVIPTGGSLTVYSPDNFSLPAQTSFTFDGSAETKGSFNFILGSGRNTIKAGSQNDAISARAKYLSGDSIDGGGGFDTLRLGGNGVDGLAHVVLGPTTLLNIESIIFSRGLSYNLTTNDATVAAGQTLKVSAILIDSSHSVTFDGSAETDGRFVVFAGPGTSSFTGGAGDDLFKASAASSAVETFHGGAGNDLFVFGAPDTLTAADVVDGGAGAKDELVFRAPGASGLGNVSGIEIIALGNGGNNDVALSNALVGSANNHLVTVIGGNGSDTIDASAVTASGDSVHFLGGAGGDTLIAGSGADMFIYKSASDSTGPNYDTVENADLSKDRFNIRPISGPVTGIDAAITNGSLSPLSFDQDLAAAVDAAHLGAHHAVLFTPSAGTLAGQTFLVVDINGAAGYQAEGDLVIRLSGQTGTLTTADFLTARASRFAEAIAGFGPAAAAEASSQFAPGVHYDQSPLLAVGGIH